MIIVGYLCVSVEDNFKEHKGSYFIETLTKKHSSDPCPQTLTSWVDFNSTAGGIQTTIGLRRKIQDLTMEDSEFCRIMEVLPPLAEDGTTVQPLTEDSAQETSTSGKSIASSSLIPDDPVVLLTIAGMLQFNSIFHG
ncbi:hypothetical protein M8C21_007360, partial [Ambrosia artemisiifolia]